MSWKLAWGQLVGENSTFAAKDNIDKNDRTHETPNSVNSVNSVLGSKKQKAALDKSVQSGRPETKPVYGEGPPYPDSRGLVKCFYCKNLSASACRVSGKLMSGLILLRKCSEFAMNKVG